MKFYDTPPPLSEPTRRRENGRKPRSNRYHTHFSPALLWQVWKQCRQYDAVIKALACGAPVLVSRF